MTWLLVAIIVVSNTAGDVFNTAGMKRHGQVEHFNPRAITHLVLHLARNGFIIAGIASLTVSFGALIMLLSIAPVSFAIPATAASFLLETVLAKIALKERVTCKRWIGATLVAIGVALLAL
ncbi:MAG: EamA family transporter [Acidobacteriia bacterium]|nr:EamA family transporter [Terriglobia bacterium]